MTLIKPQPDPDRHEPTREALWRKRLAHETQCARRCRADGSSAPHNDGPRIRFARGLLTLLGLFARGVQNANSPVLRRHAFTFPALPPAFHGFRILHLSDFHFNERPGFTDALCALVRGIEADLCVLTGDYRFNAYAPCWSVYAGIQRLLSVLSPRHGVAAILGNNDMSDFVPHFRALGIRMLVNESLRITQDGANLWVAGVDDPHEFHCESLHWALAGVPDAAFTILLAHSPEIIPQAAQRGADLYLCGHTHGGQIRVPPIGPLYLNTRSPRYYCAGPWRHGAMQGFTTTGLGSSTLPIRFNCPPEAVLIELRAEPDPSSEHV